MNKEILFKRIIVILLIVAYIINPFDFPGPIDDIIVSVIGLAIESKIGCKDKKDKEE